MKKIIRIILLALLGVIVVGTFVFLWKKSRPKEVVYEIVTPVRKTIENKTVATGTVEPRNEVFIKPQINGIIAELYKEAGQSIRAGEVIAKVKVIPEMSQLSDAESNVRQQQINLEYVQQVYDRQKALYEQGVIAKEEFQKSATDLTMQEEALSQARERLSIIRDGISKNATSYSTTQVRSTITGMILSVPVKVGNSVIQSNTFNEGTTIAAVADMSDMIFLGKVDETDVGKVHEGMNIALTVGALENVKFNARLEYISPKGVEENGAILFEIKAAATIPKDVYIRAGYSANAEIVLARADSVLSIPEGCLEFRNDSAFVHLLKTETPQQTFEKRFVEVGLSDGINMEVKAGLTAEDKIRGHEKMDMMNMMMPKK
ncbi:MAG: efflux RND transporter periplasmic adaptor subunit [Prevotellaceae bacterium]|jgi:HlyD family secretion protein|nr:efflux RND transporter periplasmic adaptor subunit [Prevotellaceae bacterium]